MAELAQAKIPGVCFETAVDLVKHGIKLRDLKTESAEDLSKQRWACIVEQLSSESSFREVIERELRDLEPNRQLAASPISRTDHYLKGHLEEQLNRWKEFVQTLDRDMFTVQHYDLLVVLHGPRPRPDALRKPKGHAVKQPGDLVQLNTLDVGPLPRQIFKHFTARDVVSRWDAVAVCRRAS